MRAKKIAFIYYPNSPKVCRLDTMPFALYAVILLGRMGWSLDLYLWEEPSSNYDHLLRDNVTIKYIKEQKIGSSSRFIKLRLIPDLLQIDFLKSYYCVFGVGPVGAYIGSQLASFNRCPFILFNDEFPSCWDAFRLHSYKKLLKEALPKASLIVLPDANRFEPLCEEVDVRAKPYGVLPNIPIIDFPLKQINWHQRLGIPEGSIPFLCAGSLGDMLQTPELLTIFPYCHEKAVLIMNHRSRKAIEEYRQEISHLECSEKIFWNLEPLGEDEFHSLVSYCAGNFALYRQMSANLKYLGFSSGKLMRSIACGAPAIASSGFFLSFVEDYQLGVLVNHPREIPEAVNKVINNRDTYSKNCLKFCQEEASFEKAWQRLCKQLKDKIDIEL